jgi:hypothetical protein
MPDYTAMDPSHDAPAPTEQSAQYLALAAKFRESAAQSFDAELADAYLKLAVRYEVLAQGYAKQPAPVPPHGP